ncbi:MAG TPA: PP2C family protein-serine/threonine phosphatase, partial [Spirochaetota bacterium]|nr:PP2C family protein-serine/threonine phosphatase [Spirochaetota bacterium]
SNTYVMNESEYGMFVTVFYAMIDTGSKSFTYGSAGHNEQILLKPRTGEIIMLNAKGCPLGIDENAGYGEQTVNYDHGDLLLLFTDGLVESLGDEGEDLNLGYEKLNMLLKSNIHEPAERLLNIIRNAIREVYPDNELMDDLTVLAVNL